MENLQANDKLKVTAFGGEGKVAEKIVAAHEEAVLQIPDPIMKPEDNLKQKK